MNEVKMSEKIVEYKCKKCGRDCAEIVHPNDAYKELCANCYANLMRDIGDSSVDFDDMIGG